MRKLFILLTTCCLSLSGFAQSDYVDLITNGNMEDSDMSCFTGKEWVEGETGLQQYWGPARVIADPTDAANKCAVVASRDSLGTGGIEDYDSQFFIKVPDKLEAGDMYIVTMRVRADKVATAQTQAHDQPGGYIHWAMIGDVNFTTEWEEITRTGTISADQAPADRELHTIAFNLAVLKEANNYYFDDIKFEIKKATPPDYSDFDDLITNGNMEGTEMSNFVSKEWYTGEEVWGPARIVVDPTNDQNHCAIVTSRDIPEGKETIEDWDSQFFITVSETLEAGDEYRVTFKVRADKPATGQTQAHDQPGGYIHWAMIGDVSFTTEWKEITRTGTITSDQAPDGKELHTIAFNLAVMKEANNYYFDDIKFLVKKAKPVENWFNMVRNGDLETDLVSNFIGRDGADGIDRPARIVTLEDGSRAMNVTSVASSPNPETGEETITDWQTQFFFTSNHKLIEGEKYRFVMEAMADKNAQIQSQIHRAPGDYQHFEMVGNFDLTPTWQRFEVNGVVSSEQAGGYTIAFNCNVLKEVNNYYFRNIEFNIDQDVVTEADLIVGSEEIELPVPGPDEELITQVDMDNAMYILDTKDFNGLISGENMKVQGADGLLGANVSAATGAAFNMQGIGDSDGTITLEVTPENADAKIANFVVNNIGSEILSEDVSTRVAFEQDGWYYVYNVKFVNGAVPPVVLGDVNADGSIDIQDVSLTVERILSKAPEGFIEANADLDGDGDITVQDVSLIVAIIISGN